MRLRSFPSSRSAALIEWALMSKPIHVFAPFARAMEPMLEVAFPQRTVVGWTTEEEFTAGLGEVELILTLFSPKGHWVKATDARLIQCMGAGVDDVLGEPLPPGVQVANNRGAAAPTMSEFGLALILALLKQLPQASAHQRSKTWGRYLAEPMAGKTLGILGAGAIGSALAEKAQALGMRVVATQRTPKSHHAIETVYGMDGTDAVLEEADVLVLLLPLTDETRDLLSASRIAKMKPGSYLVNLARGGIVDEVAVREALETGHLAGAAFDVFHTEPLPKEDPFWDAPNLLITPHVAGGFPDYLPRVVELFAENVRRLEVGEPLLNPVDLGRGY